MFDAAQHGIEALTDVELCLLPRYKIWHLLGQMPELAFDLAWLGAREESRVDENLLSAGRRSAVERIADPRTVIACRVHDECNGSDVFGSDICTCRPYLVHGIEVCVETAQQGGVGIIVYNRKEGRALGEVTKFLVYNASKRQSGGDRADTYFRRTECVAGVQDMRFQELMPDVFHWLGIRRIDRWVSMSNLKRDALTGQGIEVVEQVAIPDRLVPLDAAVEIEAKKAAGYFAPAGIPDPEELSGIRGRALDD